MGIFPFLLVPSNPQSLAEEGYPGMPKDDVNDLETIKRSNMILPLTSPGYGSHKGSFSFMPSKHISRLKLYSFPAALVLFILSAIRYTDTASCQGNYDSILKGTRKGLLKENNKVSFPLPHLKSLVLVACHSVYKETDYGHPEDVHSWSLLEYQKKTPGQTHSFLEHIQLGVREAAADEKSILLFSGGQTRREAGPRAESMGYWMVAEASDWFGHRQDVRERAFTEEHSRDSLENVMFSLCRFHELTGNFPEKITIISYEFKEKRFMDIHRNAIGWPQNRMTFVGTPTLDPKAISGEEHVRSLFEKDPYGCRGELAKKRVSRDPFGNGGYHADRCPAMRPLLDMVGCQTTHARMEGLPWKSRV